MTREEENKKNLAKANELLHSLCKEYRLNCIDVCAENFGNLRSGKFCSDRNYIAINRLYLCCYEHVIFHEFRHYWQREKYPKVYSWWMREHIDLYEDFQKSIDKNNKRLAYLYCPLERDAVAFEKSDEGDEEALKNPILDEVYWRKVWEEKKDKTLEE